VEELSLGHRSLYDDAPKSWNLYYSANAAFAAAIVERYLLIARIRRLVFDIVP